MLCYDLNSFFFLFRFVLLLASQHERNQLFFKLNYIKLLPVKANQLLDGSAQCIIYQFLTAGDAYLHFTGTV